MFAGCSAELPSPPAQARDSASPLIDHGLPPEAIETLALIRRGGPFPYRKDGTIFHNREQRLPQQPRGFYREYTVPTPGAQTRGARRIRRKCSITPLITIAASGEFRTRYDERFD